MRRRLHDIVLRIQQCPRTEPKWSYVSRGYALAMLYKFFSVAAVPKDSVGLYGNVIVF